jgi:transketolase
MSVAFGPRRGIWIDLTGQPSTSLDIDDGRAFETLDYAYRALCAMLYNYAPLSGHPGGSISSGRFVAALLFDAMSYDFARPDRDDADAIVFAAGHKALGLYAMSALRNEIMRIAAPALLPPVAGQLRLEDLLGFRRNPARPMPISMRFGSKALDGHPTPATPFVKLATGASGVGDGAALGYALAAADWFGASAPYVHIVEGEGGLTPGRVAEALAFAGTASLGNAVLHVDWNQSSIDSDRVTREGDMRGDYVQWDPMELAYANDWNVIYVPDGTDFQTIVAAQHRAAGIGNGQPTAIVYRTTKGWRYGIEGRGSHGAGHKLCSRAFFEALPLPDAVLEAIPRCDAGRLCSDGRETAIVERCFWDGLTALRGWLESEYDVTRRLAARVVAAQRRLDAASRTPRPNAPMIDDVYALAAIETTPSDLVLKPDTKATLRGQLGATLGFLNRLSGGAIFIAAADLLGSTSVAEGAKDFAPGFHAVIDNPDSRQLAVGGICEDAIAAVLSGVSGFGKHIGAGASYGAFIAPLGHIAARLHAIGNQARHERTGEPARPFVLICGHAGLGTGEDGPTHADPQPLQLLQENFPRGAAITLTPWEPNEIWPLFAAALSKRPSLIAPFVTRPTEIVPDREALGLAPADHAARGVYRLRKARGTPDVVVVLQESGVTYEFVTHALPRLLRDGIDVEAWYIASAELYDLLPENDRPKIPADAIGITGFTLPTMYRWIVSEQGRAMTMHPFMNGRYPGSGPGPAVIAEAGLDGESQYRQIVAYAAALARDQRTALLP